MSSTVWCYSAVRQLQATAVQSDSSGLPSPLCRHAPIDPLAVPVHIYPTCTYHHRTCDHTPCDHHTPVSARLASPDFCFWKLVPQPSPPPVTPACTEHPQTRKVFPKIIWIQIADGALFSRVWPPGQIGTTTIAIRRWEGPTSLPASSFDFSATWKSPGCRSRLPSSSPLRASN